MDYMFDNNLYGTGFDLGSGMGYTAVPDYSNFSYSQPSFVDYGFNWGNIGNYSQPMNFGNYQTSETPWYSDLYNELGGAKGVMSLGLGGLSLLGNWMAQRDSDELARDQLDAQTSLKQQELDTMNNMDLAKTDALMRLVQERQGVSALDPRRYAQVLASGQLPVEDIIARTGLNIGEQQGFAVGGPFMAPQMRQSQHAGALGLLRGASPGQADNMNAALSHGEYVVDADVVSALGDGNTEAGAKKLDGMREQVRAHKRGAPKGKIPPPAKDVMTYMKGR